MQDASLHSYFKTPGFTDHDGAVGVPAATQPDSAERSESPQSITSQPDSAQRSAPPQWPQAADLRAQAHALLRNLQRTDEFACESPTIGPAAPYLAVARQWLATVSTLPAPTRSLLLPEQSLLTRLTLCHA